MTNQWVEPPWATDSGPDYTHCIVCGRAHSLFTGADFCHDCRRKREEWGKKKTGERGECRGGCGCTVQWSVLRCSACRAANKWRADPSTKEMRGSTSAVNWDRLERSRGKAKKQDEARIAAYLETMKGK